MRATAGDGDAVRYRCAPPLDIETGNAVEVMRVTMTR
jgi:hypothetical protein